MLVVICYDVSTETPQGRRRLQRAAKLCERKGERVQKSVFECQLNQMQYEAIEQELLAVINEEEDNLRFYRIADNVDCRVKEYGRFRSTDFDDPLIL